MCPNPATVQRMKVQFSGCSCPEESRSHDISVSALKSSMRHSLLKTPRAVLYSRSNKTLRFIRQFIRRFNGINLTWEKQTLHSSLLQGLCSTFRFLIYLSVTLDVDALLDSSRGVHISIEMIWGCVMMGQTKSSSSRIFISFCLFFSSLQRSWRIRAKASHLVWISRFSRTSCRSTVRWIRQISCRVDVTFPGKCLSRLVSPR